MPIKVPGHAPENFSITSDIVLGGVEKFMKLVYDNIDGIIPLYITREDIRTRKTRSKVASAVFQHKPDMVLSNYSEYPYCGYFQELNIPLIHIAHQSPDRGIVLIQIGPKINDVIDNLGHVYFVSDNQYQFHTKQCMRVHGVNINQIKGFIRPAYTEENMAPFSGELVYDYCTIGRNDKEKNPFWVHKKLSGTDKLGIVMTTKPTTLKSKQVEYAEDNLHWELPQQVEYELPHTKVIENLSKSKVFISTCPIESWGITVLEALSCGVPVILVTNSTGKHSSEEIAADKSHYVKVKSNISRAELEKIIDKLSNYSYNKRLEISNMTKEKHNLQSFKNQLNDMIETRYTDTIDSGRKTLFDLF